MKILRKKNIFADSILLFYNIGIKELYVADFCAMKHGIVIGRKKVRIRRKEKRTSFADLLSICEVL